MLANFLSEWIIIFLWFALPDWHSRIPTSELQNFRNLKIRFQRFENRQVWVLKQLVKPLKHWKFESFEVLKQFWKSFESFEVWTPAHTTALNSHRCLLRGQGTKPKFLLGMNWALGPGPTVKSHCGVLRVPGTNRQLFFGKEWPRDQGPP